MMHRLLSLACGSFRELRQKLRAACLRLGGVTMGEGCVVGRGVRVTSGVVLGRGVILGEHCELSGQVVLGDRVVVQKHAEIAGRVEVGEATVVAAYASISTMPTAHISIGKRVLVNSFNIIGAGEEVSIGDDCIFAPYVQITDSSHRYENASDSPRHDPAFSKPVSINRGVWLGSGVKVLMGSEIGEGAVVGAGAVVTRSLPALAVAAGVPAKVLRYRNKSAGVAPEDLS